MQEQTLREKILRILRCDTELYCNCPSRCQSVRPCTGGDCPYEKPLPIECCEECQRRAILNLVAETVEHQPIVGSMDVAEWLRRQAGQEKGAK